MASVNQIASEIVHSLGKNNDYDLKEHVKSIIVHIRNELIRRSMENHGYVDKGLQQKFSVSLKNNSDPNNLFKVTTQKVPRPVRLVNNLPFIRVSTGSKEIAFVKESANSFRKHLPGMRGCFTYDYSNDFITVFAPANVDKLEINPLINLSSIIIEGVFEHPTEINTEGKYDYEIDDDEWLIPEDMIGQLKELIYKRDLINYRTNVAGNEGTQARQNNQ